MKDVGGADKLPTARFFAPAVQTQASSREKFFGATWPVRKAAQNDTLFESEKAKVKRQKGVEYLPAARFFGRTKRTHRAAENDTLFESEKAKVKRQKGAEYFPMTRFYDLGGMVQKIYTAEIGIRESTNRNDGKRIEEYLAYVGLGKGNPWCAAFICWVYGKAGVTNPGSGWSPALFPEARIIWTRRRGDIKNSLLNIQYSDADPRRADIFGIWFQDKKRIAHCGFIDDWQEKYVITVEGNTNESGSREGDGVYRKRRLISTVYKVARWVG